MQSGPHFASIFLSENFSRAKRAHPTLEHAGTLPPCFVPREKSEKLEIYNTFLKVGLHS
jgi:hypothetical protein